MKWYNIEVPYSTREYINRADRFKEWLDNNNIKFELSAAGNMVHFEIYLDENCIKDVDRALERIVFYDAINEVWNMDKDKYMRIACELYNTGEITGEIYDAMILNADEFCDDDDDDQLPPTYSEIEYDDMVEP